MVFFNYGSDIFHQGPNQKLYAGKRIPILKLMCFCFLTGNVRNQIFQNVLLIVSSLASKCFFSIALETFFLREVLIQKFSSCERLCVRIKLSSGSLRRKPKGLKMLKCFFLSICIKVHFIFLQNYWFDFSNQFFGRKFFTFGGCLQ